MAEFVETSIYEMTAADLPDPESWPQGAAVRALAHARGLANLTWTDGATDDQSTVDTIVKSAVRVGNTYGADGVERRVDDPLVAYYAANSEIGVRAAFAAHRTYLVERGQPVDENLLGGLATWANIYASNLVRDYYDKSARLPAVAVDHQMMARREEAQDAMTNHLRQMSHLATISSL